MTTTNWTLSEADLNIWGRITDLEISGINQGIPVLKIKERLTKTQFDELCKSQPNGGIIFDRAGPDYIVWHTIHLFDVVEVK